MTEHPDEITPAHPFPFEHPAVTVRPCNGGIQWVFRFANGYGASVVQHPYSYGGDQGLWEMAVTDHSGRLVYTTPVTDDVLGYQDEQQIAAALDQTCRLEAM